MKRLAVCVLIALGGAMTLATSAMAEEMTVKNLISGAEPETIQPVQISNGATLQKNGRIVDPYSNTPFSFEHVAAIADEAASYSSYNLALLQNGRVTAWGYDWREYGGEELVQPHDLGFTEATAIATGQSYGEYARAVRLVLLKNGTVHQWHWGQDPTDQPPFGAIAVPGVSEATAIAAGLNYNLALLQNGTVKEWRNGECHWNNGFSCETPSPVTVPGISEAIAIAVNQTEGAAVLKNGSVVRWQAGGSSRCTVSGIAEAATISMGEERALALLKNGTVVQWESAEEVYGENPATKKQEWYWKVPGCTGGVIVRSAVSGTSAIDVSTGGRKLEAITPVGATLHSPSGRTHDAAGNEWVADTGNHRLVEFNNKGEYLRQAGEYGTGPGQFVYVYGVATDSSGDVFATDMKNSRVTEFSPTGALLRTFGGSATTEPWQNFSSGGVLVEPSGITVDSSGNVWVLNTRGGTVAGEGHRIWEFSSTGATIRGFGGKGASEGSLGWAFEIAVSGETVSVNEGSTLKQFTTSGVFLK